MAIRNTLLGGTDFADGEVLYDYDLDDTNNEMVYNDGFIYIDVATVSTTATTPTLVRTYTFNKPVDGLFFSTHLYAAGSLSVDDGYLYLKKNGVALESEVIALGGFATGGAEKYWDGVKFNHQDTIDNAGVLVYIDANFGIGDSFELYLEDSSGGTTQISNTFIQGVRNKSNDTTWMSVT